MRVLLSTLSLLTIFSGGLQAGSIEDQVKQAIDFAKTGRSADSVLAMRGAALDLWLQTPFGFSQAMFVEQSVPRYGAYNPRETNTFTSEQPVFVYIEPIGYDWTKEGDFYTTELVVDAALLSADRETLWSQDKFGDFKLSGRQRFMEFMVNLELDIDGLPPGDFILEYTLTDNISGQKSTVSLPFVSQ